MMAFQGGSFLQEIPSEILQAFSTSLHLEYMSMRAVTKIAFKGILLTSIKTKRNLPTP